MKVTLMMYLNQSKLQLYQHQARITKVDKHFEKA